MYSSRSRTGGMRASGGQVRCPVTISPGVRYSEPRGSEYLTPGLLITWSQHRNPEPADEALDLAAQERERRDDEQLVLHARRVVVGLDHLVGHERTVDDVVGQREWNLVG